MNEQLIITLDTNCINSRSASASLNVLHELHARGRIRLVKTDVMDTELKGWKGSRGERARGRSDELEEDMGVLILGHSRIGHTRIAGEDDVVLYEAVAQEIFGEPSLKLLDTQSVRDVMLVATHIKHDRDILVTNDGAVLRAASALADGFRMNIMSPDDCVEHLQDFSSGSPRESPAFPVNRRR